MSATRGEATLSSLGVSTDVLDRERIEDRAAPSLLPLLQEVAGRRHAREPGRRASRRSVFVRGGESRFARVMIDGVAVNQPGGAYDFGSALPFELERVEVVRGAASSLYGGDALAGVVSLETRRARAGERPSLRAEAEAGSFAWQRYLGATSGRAGGLDWNAGVQRLTTDNEAPNSRFEDTAAGLSAGARLRSAHATCGSSRATRRAPPARPGPRPTAAPISTPPSTATTSWSRRCCAGAARPCSASSSAVGYALDRPALARPRRLGLLRARVGRRRSGSYPNCDFPNPAGFQNQTDRLVGLVPGGLRRRVAAAADGRRRAGARDGRARQPLGGAAASRAHELRRLPAGPRARRPRAYLTLGGRVERNGSYGTHAVPRAALAVRLRDGADATTLRASAGMGVKEPSFFESYGESFFAQGNPDLDPERSTTFDLGVEQRLLREPAARVGHVLPSRLPRPDRLHGRGLRHVPGHLREPRAHARAGPRAGARGAPAPRARRSSASTPTATARSSTARATSIPCTRWAARCCGGRRTRRRSRRSGALPRWSAGPDARLRRRARGQRLRRPRSRERPVLPQPRVHAPRRAGAGADRRLRSRPSCSPTTCSTRSTRKRSAIRRSAARSVAGFGCGWAADARERVRARAARLEQRQGQRLRPPPAAGAGCRGRGPADHDQRGLRPRRDARRAALAAARAGRRGRPAARGGAHPVALPEPGLRSGDGRGARGRARAGHDRGGVRGPVPRGREALPRGAHAAARGSSRCSRSGAGRRARWPRR